MKMWTVLILVRLLLVILPQTGYLHPDEFFQSTEIMAGNIFGMNITAAWEFNTSFPMRSVTFTYIIVGIPYICLKTLSDIFSFVPSGYVMVVLPRLIITLFSLLHDWWLYKLCCMYRKDYVSCLTLFCSSYVCLVFYTRTFSNTVEALFMSALLYVVGKAMYLHDYHKKGKSKQESKQIEDSSIQVPYGTNIVAVIITGGFFNRPTFLLFATTPVLFWILTGLDLSWSSSTKLLKRLASLVPLMSLTALQLILVDSLYYTELSFSNLMTFQKDWTKLLDHVVITPINFIIYNTNRENLKEHGLHPWYLHLFVNIPLLYSVLGLCSFWQYISTMKKLITSKLTCQLSAITGLMISSIFFPVLTLSAFPHQEPRFLISLLMPLAFLCSEMVFNKFFFTFFWCFTNVLCTIFFGFLHQGGLVPCLLNLQKIVDLKARDNHVVFFHTYMPPQHLMRSYLIDDHQSNIQIHDLAGGGTEELKAKISTLLNDPQNKNTFVYLVIPGTLKNITNEMLKKSKDKGLFKIELETIGKFFPHLSMEDPPHLQHLNIRKNTTSLVDELVTLFTLYLFKVS
ncbi:GPI mannosyltransferase 4-like [Limulus polyphemus]|uniref:Mannosyltransferase n=1 Tax=Limulus polyphemus TaxID=6850 RepID=A0ABM1TN76_LIMPO|nr:GPI mannosyltransferase 4-like [Limulus polyphemus]XP_022257332.1 GPI mannosyltransferase 4-like [Limulus polyphemus]XP_022257333.1 GPI mannosyltransferase 4-like [Limulus polyphemus]XP_022257334.1 GPI mannosyltransferase 4-like [Limulus polyphemus]XP_022257335.1 GPI mannosyltransferase 4-like [Limulus polyphemus]XP_022257336.1 GPI mannosyltransferase 4-like [Limulus polyphemus]XP_022257337.1 GPI mannosyltransferase 4-like [Limulus polyphemus]XP_022257338.1 GPI mannosyltransferase 4-like 